MIGVHGCVYACLVMATSLLGLSEIFPLQITVHVQTTGVRMVGVVQSVGVEVTGVVVRGVGVANFVIKAST